MQDVYRHSTIRGLAASLLLQLPAGTSEQPSQPVKDEHTQGPRPGGLWGCACGWVQHKSHAEHVAEMAAKEKEA